MLYRYTSELRALCTKGDKCSTRQSSRMTRGSEIHFIREAAVSRGDIVLRREPHSTNSYPHTCSRSCNMEHIVLSISITENKEPAFLCAPCRVFLRRCFFLAFTTAGSCCIGLVALQRRGHGFSSHRRPLHYFILFCPCMHALPVVCGLLSDTWGFWYMMFLLISQAFMWIFLHVCVHTELSSSWDRLLHWERCLEWSAFLHVF